MLFDFMLPSVSVLPKTPMEFFFHPKYQPNLMQYFWLVVYDMISMRMLCVPCPVRHACFATWSSGLTDGFRQKGEEGGGKHVNIYIYIYIICISMYIPKGF